MYNHGRKWNHPILPLVCSHDPCEVEMELLVQVENHHPHDNDDSTSPCLIVEGLKTWSDINNCIWLCIWPCTWSFSSSNADVNLHEDPRKLNQIAWCGTVASNNRASASSGIADSELDDSSVSDASLSAVSTQQKTWLLSSQPKLNLLQYWNPGDTWPWMLQQDT